ncbi:MAG: response regulator [Thermodesulfobacteriota bacterium]|nr:response regulator [Thermodesulfobacteriota bacterium]
MRRKQIYTERTMKQSPNEMMDDIIRLRTYLIQKGRLTEDQFLQAEDYALTRKMSIDEAILFLNLMDYTEFGESLAEIYGKSYHPLLEEPPQGTAREFVPLKLAEKWNIFPVNYDPKKKILTLAIDNPEDHLIIGQIQTIFPAGVKLVFFVASKAEIAKAIDVHYRGRTYTPERDLEVPHDFAILGSEKETEEEIEIDCEEEIRTKKKILVLEPDFTRAGALKTILRCEGYRDVSWILSLQDMIDTLRKNSPDFLLVNNRTFQRQGSWLKDIPKDIDLPHISYYDLSPLLFGQEYPYHQMSEALIDLTAFLVRKSLENDADKLQETLTRVRLCKLLALRLHLFPAQVDATVLAAWFSTRGVGKDLLGSITTPYHLEEILNFKLSTENGRRIESTILEMVIVYQSLRRSESEMSQDINRLRSILSRQFPSGEYERILETFLHLIKDEEFLKRVDHHGGIILIVDSKESKESSMSLRLSNDGYQIEVVSDVREAIKTLSQFRVDLIISEVNLPETDGLSFCRTIRENSLGGDVSFFFLTEEEGERLPAKCLEAGADDFLKKPVDMEILSLKIARVLALKGSQKSKRGVNGSLKEMNSTDFIQSLSEGHKDVEITLKSMGEKGIIYMQSGEIIHASLGDLYGENAFYRLMTWQDGEFQIVPYSTFPPRTIHHSTMSLLMEAARIADEANAAEDEEC